MENVQEVFCQPKCEEIFKNCDDYITEIFHNYNEETETGTVKKY